jgi:hypothetical protein
MKNRPVLYTRYPTQSIITYNGITILHFMLGGAGFVLGYHFWLGYMLGSLYIVFSFVEMYILMPLKVCPNCPYYVLPDSLCVSGLNVVSRKLTKQGDVKNFSNRARGLFCANNLYIASLAIPIIGIIPGLALNFSWVVLGILLVLIGLLAFRFFYIFTNIACVHCRAQNICPQAKQMGFAK